MSNSFNPVKGLGSPGQNRLRDAIQTFSAELGSARDSEGLKGANWEPLEDERQP